MSWYCDIATWLEKSSVVQVFSDDGQQEQDYLPERTCNMEHMRAFAPSVIAEHPEIYPFCPHCGARVEQ